MRGMKAWGLLEGAMAPKARMWSFFLTVADSHVFGHLLWDMLRGSPKSCHVQHASTPDTEVFATQDTASKELARCP